MSQVRGSRVAADPGRGERASWFSLADFGAADLLALRYGLYDWQGRSPGARRLQRRAGRPNRSCGTRVDRRGPKITIAWPADNKRASRTLHFKASARDASGLRPSISAICCNE